MLPYWLLTYEEMQALMLDRSDQNAPNQAMVLSREILKGKDEYTCKCLSLTDTLSIDILSNVATISSGLRVLPFSVLAEIFPI